MQNLFWNGTSQWVVDERLVERFGGEYRLTNNKIKVEHAFKIK